MSRPVPPLRVVFKGWFGPRELDCWKAEAYHLREAAKLVGNSLDPSRRNQAEHLLEAERNREWTLANRMPMQE